MESAENKISQRLFVVEGLPLRYLVIPKCGCTYVKNVLYRLKNGRSHDNPIRVHDSDGNFKRAIDIGLKPSDIEREEFAFTVIRKPVDRFLSLYTDKIVGNGRKNYVPLADTLVQKRGLVENASSINEHRRNLDILIDWLSENIQSEIDLPKEAHWTPQIYRQNIMKQCNLKILLVEKLTPQLEIILDDIIPNAAVFLSDIERNSSRSAYSKSDLLTNDLRKKVSTTYSMDQKLYQRARKSWNELGERPSVSDIPRFRTIMNNSEN